jgi:inhibitor of cysteine peptidase
MIRQVKNVVQKEIKKKSQVYGLMAILLSIVLVTLIYTFGSVPTVLPPNASPSASVLSSPGATTSPNVPPSPYASPPPSSSPTTATAVSPMKTFSNYTELYDFLINNTQGGSPVRYYGGDFSSNSVTSGTMPTPSPMPMPTAAPATAQGVPGTSAVAPSAESYSPTNIQVAGVDEADVVKTDGRYIYLISNENVYVLKADPQDAKVLSKIPFNNTDLLGLFLSQDGSKLAVLGNKYEYLFYPYSGDETGLSGPTPPVPVPTIAPGMTTGPTVSTTTPSIAPVPSYYFVNDEKTFLNVYDVSNPTNPVLARNLTLTGNYFDSRMIGDYLYAVVSQPTYIVNGTVILPRIYTGGQGVAIPASSIYYTDFVDNYYTYTTFIGLNIMKDAQEAANMTIMMGGTSDMYVSPTNIYVTYPNSNWQVMPLVAQTGTPQTGMPIKIMPTTTTTAIYRISINKNELTFEANGNVTGNVLNQYSMDEYNGYFRIATNSWTSGALRTTETQQNNVYTLDMNLNVVGKLENLASGENLHAARFMGDKCYLVTFQKTDPLFVIDLSEPANPTVLGNLTIPGYSDYLHPYDEIHLIGIGKDTVEASQGSFAWYQGLKLSLFDVSNVNNPQQVANYIIGDRGTDSPVLTDPKAFLFDKATGLLVIPVEVAQVDRATTPPGPNAYGVPIWQGAYVFKLTLKDGFTLKGTVTQIQNPIDPKDYNSYWQNSNLFINRALYIGNTLYTISESKVKLNALDTLAPVAEINLG